MLSSLRGLLSEQNISCSSCGDDSGNGRECRGGNSKVVKWLCAVAWILVEWLPVVVWLGGCWWLLVVASGC